MNKSKSDAATANGEANQFESEFEADAAMNTDDVKAGDNIWKNKQLLSLFMYIFSVQPLSQAPL